MSFNRHIKISIINPIIIIIIVIIIITNNWRAAYGRVAKVLDRDPEGWWFKSQCSNNQISAAVGAPEQGP